MVKPLSIFQSFCLHSTIYPKMQSAPNDLQGINPHTRARNLIKQVAETRSKPSCIVPPNRCTLIKIIWRIFWGSLKNLANHRSLLPSTQNEKRESNKKYNYHRKETGIKTIRTHVDYKNMGY